MKYRYIYIYILLLEISKVPPSKAQKVDKHSLKPNKPSKQTTTNPATKAKHHHNISANITLSFANPGFHSRHRLCVVAGRCRSKAPNTPSDFDETSRRTRQSTKGMKKSRESQVDDSRCRCCMMLLLIFDSTKTTKANFQNTQKAGKPPHRSSDMARSRNIGTRRFKDQIQHPNKAKELIPGPIKE